MIQHVKDYLLYEPPLYGGMSVVYKGYNGIDCHAFKSIRPDVDAAEIEKYSTLLRNEARMLQCLEGCPEIVRPIDVFTHTDEEGRQWPMLEMEWLEGADLQRIVHHMGMPLSEFELRRIIQAVIHIMKFAHKQGVLHLDLKPANLFLAEDGILHLVDFGIARLQDEMYASKADETVAPIMPAAGASFATRAYAAPEQLIGASLTPSTDVYAFGRTLQFLATGSESPSAIIKIDWLADFVALCTRLVPRSRPSSFSDVENAFREAAPTQLHCTCCGAPCEEYDCLCGTCGALLRLNLTFRKILDEDAMGLPSGTPTKETNEADWEWVARVIKGNVHSDVEPEVEAGFAPESSEPKSDSSGSSPAFENGFGEIRLCPQCHNVCDMQDAFCIHCGTSLMGMAASLDDMTSPLNEEGGNASHEVCQPYHEEDEDKNLSGHVHSETAEAESDVEHSEPESDSTPEYEFKPKLLCPQCHKVCDGQDAFCIHCGTSLMGLAANLDDMTSPLNEEGEVPSKRLCPQCGKECDEQDVFCIHCGNKLS